MSSTIYYNIEYTINGQQTQQEAELGAVFSGIVYNEGNAIIDIIIYKEQQLGDAIVPGQTLTFSLQPFQFLRIKGVFIAKIKFLFDQQNSSSSSSTVRVKGVLTFTQEGAGSIDIEGTYVNAQITNNSSNPVPTTITNTPNVNVANTLSVTVANSSTSPVPTTVTNTPSVTVANSSTSPVPTTVTNTPSVTVANSSTSPVPTTVTNTPNVNVNQLTVSTVASAAGASVSANTNILSSNYTPPQAGKIRITFAANASGVLSIVIVSGTTSYVYALNAGNTLNANVIYTFEIPVSSSFSYNIQYSVSATGFYQIDFIPS